MGDVERAIDDTAVTIDLNPLIVGRSASAHSRANLAAPGRLKRVAFIGNSLPRRCGIATFTSDLQQAVAASVPGLDTCILAMTDPGHRYAYPPSVRLEIGEDDLGNYIEAAAYLNGGDFDVVCLQHEFGIFGGADGDHVLALLSRLTMPIVTTLHTVLAEPTPLQRSILGRIVEASAAVVVMAEKGRDLLRSVYGVPEAKIEVVPHGVPDFPFVDSEAAKVKLGFAGRTVILTFGLLSPNKGIEVMIDAMPSIIGRCPNAVYVVLGATHPNLVRRCGESYRESLVARVQDLGIAAHVVFLDRFVDQPTLLDFISMCDVYVTPYLNAGQMTSGTLAYSFGLGKPVVSTPYWHAQELLADGRGVLVPFGDAATTGREVADLLTDRTRQAAMRQRAYSEGRAMIWARIAERYVVAFEAARRRYEPNPIARFNQGVAARGRIVLPEMRTEHFLSMCDDTGLLQHAVHSIPDRYHGYCVDDNARALLLACALEEPGESPLAETLTTHIAAFVQHAWNPDTRRFRNFMSYDRRWLEETGSEDSHGRTLWALGTFGRGDRHPSRQRWAMGLFAEALPVVEHFGSPRAWAFILLGLDGYCAVARTDSTAQRLRLILADRLKARFYASETPDWVWFEDGLTYDNARLSQALILTGIGTGRADYLDIGLRSLHWLAGVQTGTGGCFRPVGTDGFGERRLRPRAFDQQPVEAAAMISACLAASHVGDAEAWTSEARRAFAWFLGSNDLAVSLVDLDTGSCRDGLHRDRGNENRGAESVLSYLIGLAEMRRLTRMNGDRPHFERLRAIST